MEFTPAGVRKVPTTFRLPHSNGHALLDNGTIYYSPNCARTIQVPPYKSNISRRYFFRYWTDTAEAYMQPDWWSTSAGYLSFITLVPAFDNFVFSCLKNVEISVFYDSDDQPRWRLDVDTCEQWQILQDRLILVAHLLRRNIKSLSCFLPPPPSMFGFAKYFHVKQTAVSKIFSARDWFQIWIGTLCFLLSQANDTQRNHLFALLADENVEQA